MARHVQAICALAITAVVLSACATSVTGRPIRPSGPPSPGGSTPARAAISARDLLLQEGDATPLGRVTAAPVGDNYFTSVRPPECSAALLFKGSPVLPTGKSVHAESGYRFGGPALYAESVDVYDKALKTREVVSDDFAAVSQCHGDAVGVAPSGSFGRCGSVSSAQRTMAFWYGP